MKESFGERNDYVLHGRAHDRAIEVYSKKIKNREPKDFIGGEFYTEESIETIEEKVNIYKKLFKEELDKYDDQTKERFEMSKKLADCLEGIILNTKSWFGPTSEVYPTTEWDDYVNGVDLVVERMKGGIMDHHGFALDVTYGGYNTILKKVNRILGRLKKGNLGKVDFFKSNDGRFKGELREIPLVVIGADGNSMRGLVNLFAEKEDQKIEDHPVQFQIIEQVLMQCNFFIKIAETIEDEFVSNRITKAYENLKKDFELIKKSKQLLNLNTGVNFRDTFHENLTDILTGLAEESAENK